ncbi:uncharacterized protein [Clytia hemisphaerica]|uniref:RhoGEF domain containing protein n=1 Tax=Clytia hemisphaerica TaxID=252671 RepID=A0A7M5X137_9CNID
MFPSYGDSMYSPTDFLLHIFVWSSRSSFGSSDGNDSTTSDLKPNNNNITQVEQNKDQNKDQNSILIDNDKSLTTPTNFNKKHRHSFKDSTQADSDLIQLKSPTSPTNSTSPGSTTAPPTRRRSAECHSTSPPYYATHTAENDRLHQLASAEQRLSTVVTPTATSFSREDLNEIFNITRDTMEIEKSPNIHNNPAETRLNNTLNESFQDIPQSPDQHNIAIDESNFLLDNTITEETLQSCAPPPSNSIGNPIPQTNDNNNNTKDNENIKQTTLLDLSNPQNTPVDTPCTTPQGGGGPSRSGSMSKLQMVCREIFMTEKQYVSDLQDIIEGYIYHLKQKGDLDVESIFGNLEDIFEFNKEVLYQIEQCETDRFEIDPIQLAKVFIEKARGFNNHYTHYCTNYPEASHFFSIIMQDPNIAAFFLERQKFVGHALSLESYLLKPVQRILKYHLLFRDILKRYEGSEDGYDIINTAVLAMTDVAEYINEMKRLHENAVKVQEILNNVVYIDVPIDVYATGRLVLENSFKVQGARSDRIMYLFEKLLLICKKREDQLLLFKEKIECCNMMLVESIAKDPLGFQIMRFDNRKVNYTIIAKTTDIKKEWVKELKRLILENHAAVIPQTARQAILGEEKAKSKYNSLQFHALDDTVMTNVRNLNKKPVLKSPMSSKENHLPMVGSKRESNEKETFSPKRPLNAKAKEYLTDKKTTNRLTQSGSALTTQPQSPEKEKKEKLPKWMKRHIKQKNSLDGTVNLDTSTEMSTEDLYIPQTGVVKSRSLESLKDALKDQEHESKAGSNILKDIINYNFDQQIDDVIQDVQPMQTLDVLPIETTMHIMSRPTSSVLTNTETVQDGSVLTPTNIEQLEIPDPDQPVTRSYEFTSGIRITKSNSLSLRKKGGSVDDILASSFEKKHQRWSSIPSDPSRLERLEHRLSLLSDDHDESSNTSIKNMVRKVSNAFNSSFQAYEDSPRSHSTADSDVSRDLGKLLGTPVKTEQQEHHSKLSFRRSTGGILDNITDAMDENIERNTRSQSDCVTYKTETNLLEPTQNDPIEQQVENIVIDSNSDIEEKPIEIIDNQSKKDDSNEDLSKRWSTDVDQVFDEVNADLDSIADSIASDTVKSDTEGAATEPTYEVTSVGMDIAHRAAIVDQRLKEANNVDTVFSPMSTKRVNVEVKRVADRIKEYKRLVDAEKRRTSWRRREPKSMNEMIESLETIKSTDNGLTPTYQNMRRRYRSSRDFEGTSITSSTDPSPRSSCSSIKRSLSENFTSVLENSQSEPVSYSVTPTTEVSYTSTFEQSTDVVDSVKTITDSIQTLNHKKDKALDNAEDITSRTERYKKALENFDARAKTLDEEKKARLKVNNNALEGRTRSENYDARTRLASAGEMKMEQTVIVRRRLKTTASANVVCRNSGDWTRKAQTLSHPKRSGAIKRIPRADSESNDDEQSQENKPKVAQPPKGNDSSSTETTSSDEKITTKRVVSRKTHHRSTSLPRQTKKRQIGKTIHEEVDRSKYINPRLSSRSNSDDKEPKIMTTRHRNENINSDNKTATLPRGRKRETIKTEKTDKSPNTHRSVSLPRRAPNMSRKNLLPPKVDPPTGENKENETDKETREEKSSSITICRSPSIRCIQSNHVNNRIKDYFVNLQKSTEVSRSRPNLVVIGNSCSDSDCETSSTDDRVSPDDEPNNNTVDQQPIDQQPIDQQPIDQQPIDQQPEAKDQILKGTVASMIQRYGKTNYVFDL